MIDIKVDLRTATAVRIGESWHAIEPGTLTIGRAVFFVPDAGPGDEGAWVSGAGYNPLSFSCTGKDGKRRVGPLSNLTYIVHETPEPCTEDYRRPECADGHTDDCEYEEPEPPHELLPVGTRVLVSEPVWDENERRIVWANPEPGKIVGLDAFQTKYRWRREWNWEEGRYSENDQWALADNRVVVHPDGPECSSPPQPVKREPTGPRTYVENRQGKQGHVVEISRREGVLIALVQWYSPGAQPVWKHMSTLTVIPADEVERCPNGQTGDECSSGENQCELCLQAEDEEGDMIERSMGL